MSEVFLGSEIPVRNGASTTLQFSGSVSTGSTGSMESVNFEKGTIATPMNFEKSINTGTLQLKFLPEPL